MANYQNGIASKNAIIDAARKLFYEKGFRSTTYRDISREANVRIGTISYHFDNLLTLASLIDAEESKHLHQQIVNFSGGGYVGLEIALMEVLIFWHVFFVDENYRRFHAEFQNTAIQNNIDQVEYFPAAYSEFRKKQHESNGEEDEVRFNFLTAALFGIDDAVNRYVFQHLDELTPEKVFRYAFEIYSSIYHFSKDELNGMFDKVIESVRALKISNVGFRITLEKE